MTYTQRYRRRRKPMGDFLDDLIGGITGVQAPDTSGVGISDCINQANATMAPFDAKVDDLIKNWNPTGFYASADLRSIVGATLNVVRQAQTAVDTASAEPNASSDSVMRATSDLARAGERSLSYLDAATVADQQGQRVINAPGFKRWVTDTMGTASSSMVTAAVIGCITPWWAGALAQFQSAFDALYGVARRFVGAVIAIGETALKVADDLPEIYDVIKWPALALLGYWVWNNIRGQ